MWFEENWFLLVRKRDGVYEFLSEGQGVTTDINKAMFFESTHGAYQVGLELARKISGDFCVMLLEAIFVDKE